MSHNETDNQGAGERDALKMIVTKLAQSSFRVNPDTM